MIQIDHSENGSSVTWSWWRVILRFNCLNCTSLNMHIIAVFGKSEHLVTTWIMGLWEGYFSLFNDVLLTIQ